MYVAELDLDAVDALAPEHDLKVRPLPRHPSVTRNISILVDDTLPAEDVRRTSRTAPPALVRVREFDRYQGNDIPEARSGC